MRAVTFHCAVIWVVLGGSTLCAQYQFGGSARQPGAAAPAIPGDTASPAGEAEPIATRQTAFTIPFSLDQNAHQNLEVELYVSADRGANWRLYVRRPASEGRFYFRAAGDGEYWFSSRTVDASAPAPPAASTQAELRVLIDTAEPQLDFQATTSPNGEITTTWNAFDTNLAPQTLQLSYQPSPGRPWRAVAIASPNSGSDANRLSGESSWWPDANSRAITVRCEIHDKAGNAAVSSRRVFLPKAAARRNRNEGAGATTSPPPDPYAPAATSEVDNPVQDERREDDAIADNSPQPQTTEWQFAATGTQRITGTSARSDAASPNEQALAYGPGQSTRHNANPLVAGRSDAGAATGADGQAYATGAGTVHEARTTSLPNGERPRMTNRRRFSLAYEVDSVGPAGVSDVELWMTTNNGQHWRRWGSDPDRQSPFEVEVDQEGIYGFRIVIVARNGLASRTPAAGDLADIWVGVDDTPPSARLTSALYGAGEHAGKLDIHWSAGDLRLADRPVTVMFSDNPDGPWTTLASGLPNTGRYLWPVEARVPKEIFLRLEVRDEAGNTAEHQLTNPISTDGLTPRGRIRRLLPLDDPDRQALRSSLPR